MSTVIHDLPGAVVRTYKDELALDQKPASQRADPADRDAVKIRIGKWDHDTGVLSLDWLTAPDGNQNEPRREALVELSLKRALDGQGRPGGCLEIFVLDYGGTNDAAMRRAISVYPDKIEFHKPVVGVPVVLSGIVTRFYSDDRRYLFNIQGDEMKITVYPVDPSRPEREWEAIGELKIPRLRSLRRRAPVRRTRAIKAKASPRRNKGKTR